MMIKFISSQVITPFTIAIGVVILTVAYFKKKPADLSQKFVEKVQAKHGNDKLVVCFYREKTRWPNAVSIYICLL